MLRLNLSQYPSMMGGKLQMINTADVNSNLSSSVDSVTRSKLSDYKPVTDLFTMKNVSTIVLRSALIPTNLVLLEYNKFMIEQEKKQQDGLIDEMEEFNWNEVLIANYNKFTNELCRLSVVSIIKKLLEVIGIESLSLSLADKLTKDIQKSAMRKYLRWPNNRYLLCQKMLFTSLRATAIGYASFFLYDIGYRFVELSQQFIITCKKKGFVVACKQFPVVSLSIFTLKKLIIFGSCWASSSLGYAIGTYVNLKNGGFIGSAVLDLIAGQAVQSLLTMF